MSKKLHKLFKCILLSLLAVFTLSFCACSWESCENPKLEDVMPTTFGEPEGLWLYKDNTRMRTDGSDPETILKEITVDDQTYTEENFIVWRMGYATATHEIFYIIEVNPDWCKFKQYVWHYNYETKEDGYLYTLPDDTNGYIQISENYVYVKAGDAAGALFDLNTRLVEDGLFGFTLSGDTLYKTSNEELTFWRDGETHGVAVPFEGSYSFLIHNENYLYFKDGRLPSDNTSIWAVSLETAESKTANTGELYQEMVVGDRLYLITDNYTLSVKFWVADGLDIKLKYTFDAKNETKHEVDSLHVSVKGFDGEYILLDCECRGVRDGQTHYANSSNRYFFDIAQDKMVKGRKSISENEIAYTEVGEYKFYVDKRGYGNGDWFSYAGYCYCFMRERNGESEVMQYNLDGEKFFDDIREF